MVRSAFLSFGPVALACLGAAPPSLIPGPGSEGHRPELLAKAQAFERQLHQLITVPLGFGLEAYVSRPESRAALEAFFRDGAQDLQAHSGKHPYELIDEYGEFGDLGMFGGVQAAGDAFRYAVLRDQGAPEAELAAARAVLLRAMDGLHWQQQITGVPGVVARGIRRITPEPGEPPLPGREQATVPLFDPQGRPQPADKAPTWRADNSGALPFLIWLDDCSKDQLDGYVLALGVLAEVCTNDPTIPADKVQRLRQDALAVARALMEPREVGAERPIDLVIMDADGRPTTYHDLNAAEVLPGIVGLDPSSGFNAIMSLGALAALAYASQDAGVREYYEVELAGARNYLGVAERSLAELVYFGTITNYSNVNMMFVALYSALRYDADPVRAVRYRAILERQAYAPGVERQAKGLKQSYFDLIYAGFRAGGSSGDGAVALADALETLGEHPSPPYWNVDHLNCDDAEIMSRDCVAADGTALRIHQRRGRGDAVVAEQPVPMRLRPSNNFLWRSDPHQVNGSANTRLNPGGDFHAAYWMGRFLAASSEATPNLAPVAAESSAEGCGCTTGQGGGAVAPWLLAVPLVLRRRRPKAPAG